MDEKERKARKTAEKMKKQTKQEKEIEEIRKKQILEEEQEQTQKDNLALVEREVLQAMRNTFNIEGLENGLINLSLISTRQDILDHIPENENEYNFIDKNYEKILNNAKKIYENDQKAKNKILSNKLKEQLKEKNMLELAQQVGYNSNKIYTKQEIEELNDKIIKLTKKIEEEKKENKKATWLVIIDIIGLILKWACIILFGWVYLIFKFLSSLSKGY